MKAKLLLVICALALGGGSSGVFADKASNTLNIGWTEDPQIVDPYQGSTRESDVICQHVFDTLLFRDPDTFKYQPALATAYRWIDDTTIEFDLRRGVKFHNGDPFTADDVVFTLNLIKQKDFPIVLRSLVDFLKGAEKIDDYKVRVKFNYPYPVSLEYFALFLNIYPKKYFETVGATPFTRAPIGTGPYKVVEVTPGKSMTLERFDDHYAGSPKGKPAIKRLQMRVMPEMQTAIAELLTGGIEWAWRVTPDQAAKVAGRGNLVSIVADTMRFSLLSFDAAGRAGKSPMQDVRVRRAFAYAINRQEMRDNLVKGTSRVVHSACYPTQFGCTEDVPKYEFNPAKAKALLAEAGYPNGFTIAMPSYGGSMRIESEAIVNYMSAVGVKIVPQMLQSPTVRQKMADGTAQLVHMSWGSGSVNDVAAGSGPFFAFQPYDMARDPEVRDLMKKAEASMDPDTRKMAYKAALQRIADQVYWLPITTVVTYLIYVDSLDFKSSVDEFPRFYFAKWK